MSAMSSLTDMYHPVPICLAFGMRVRFYVQQNNYTSQSFKKDIIENKIITVTYAEVTSTWRILDIPKDFLSMEYTIICIFCLPCL